MAVAKTYQNLKQIGKPYEKNKKMYVQVLTLKGIIKEVRWYEDETKIPGFAKNNIIIFDGRRGWGFGEKGYITLLRGNEEQIKNWALDEPLKRAWYNTLMKWYIPSIIDACAPSWIDTYVIYWKDIENLSNNARIDFFSRFV